VQRPGKLLQTIAADTEPQNWWKYWDTPAKASLARVWLTPTVSAIPGP